MEKIALLLESNVMKVNHYFVSSAVLRALSRVPEKEATALAYVRAACSRALPANQASIAQ